VRDGEARSVTLLAFAASITLAGLVAAHEVGLSRGDYDVRGNVVEARLVFARKELIGLVAGLDGDHDGVLTDAELAAGRDSLEGAIVGRVKVAADGAPCVGTLEKTGLVDQDGALVAARYVCGAQPRRLKVTLGFFDDIAFGHRNLARVTAGSAALDQVLSQRSPSFALDVPADAVVVAPEAAEASWQGVSSIVAFCAALVALAAPPTGAPTSRRSRSIRALLALAAYATAAAIGHLLASTGTFVPSPASLAIAASMSLVYAGVEALRGEGGWALLLPFGVVHGIAFRGTLTPWIAALVATPALTLAAPEGRAARGIGGVVLLVGAASLVVSLRG